MGEDGAKKFLHALYLNNSKNWAAMGFSPERVFWLEFAQTCLYHWEEKRPLSIKLSQLFSLYGEIYIKYINPHFDQDAIPALIEELKIKYKELQKIFLTPPPDSVGLGIVALKLAQSILGRDYDVFKSMAVGHMLVSTSNAVSDSLPISLDIDIAGFDFFDFIKGN
jgi:hypothetical protein